MSRYPFSRLLPVTGGGAAAPSIYPANESNTGYQNAPGYPGSLASSAGILPLIDGRTYSFYNFPSGLNNASFASGTSATGITLIGCRMASNQVNDANTYSVCTGITYSFCTFEPSTVPAGSEPPIASTGYQIAFGQGYQYGIKQNSGKFTMRNCRLWGYGNAVTIAASTVAAPVIIDRCLFQNPSADGGVYHVDGPGQLDNLTGINGLQITNNTIIGLGNTNGLALQTGSYDSCTVTGNYFAGYGFMVATGTVTGNQTNFLFQNNTWGSDALLEPGGVAAQPNGGPLYGGSVGTYTSFGGHGNNWSGNKISTAAGTTWMAAGNNGLFWWPTDGNPANASSIVGHVSDFVNP